MADKPRARDIAKQETRDALIQAGMEAFSEEGVDLPSLDGICARAGFTRGAFYVHFKDREDFLGAIVDKVLQDFVNWVISTGETQGGVVGVIDRFFTVVREGKLPFTERQRLLLQLVSRGIGAEGEHRYKALIEEAVIRLTVAVREAQGQGRMRRDLNAKQTATLLAAAAVGFIALVDAGFQPNIDEIRRTVDALFFQT